MNRPRPIASLSLDLDNLWSYLKTHGEPGWRSLPTYLPLVVPRILRFLRDRNQSITFFVVGQDAAQRENQEVLRALADEGHEIGNHSFHHEPWLHLYTDTAIENELASAEEHIERATGERPVGFRGPGFSLSQATLEVLARRGYLYDASTFPTFLGPLARMYYFMTAKLSPEEKRQRQSLFGGLREGFRPNHPYRWQTAEGPLLEIPVTTMPVCRTPIHVSYLLYLSTFARRLAQAYFRTALRLCRWTGTPLSLLLHPLDFMGCDDTTELAFFPAMRMPHADKLALVGEVLDEMSAHFEIVPMRRHAEHLSLQNDMSSLPATFPRAPADHVAPAPALDSEAMQCAP
jgi:peptidoglycan-N-acetylglucosamine deacetylase